MKKKKATRVRQPARQPRVQTEAKALQLRLKAERESRRKEFDAAEQERREREERAAEAVPANAVDNADEARTMPAWVQRARQTVVNGLWARPAFAWHCTKTPQQALSEYARFRMAIHLNAVHRGRFGPRFQVTLTALPGVKSGSWLEGRRAIRSGYKRTFPSPKSGFSDPEHAKQIACLCALDRLGLASVALLEAKYYEQYVLLKERQVQIAKQRVLSKSRYVEPSLMREPSARQCVKYGRLGEYYDVVSGVPTVFSAFCLGHRQLTCLAKNDNLPVSLYYWPAHTRLGLPVAPKGCYHAVVAAAATESGGGRVAITGYRDVECKLGTCRNGARFAVDDVVKCSVEKPGCAARLEAMPYA
ncbi:hypothetical protein DIPPA_04721 [Diplonema papillatum]|nr:hypothetical protein DIPPA_04721 [Diplonema papillatum]